MLLLQIAPAHSESRRGRERGRSIPFATFPYAAKFGRYRGIADMVALVAGPIWSRMTHRVISLRCDDLSAFGAKRTLQDVDKGPGHPSVT
jgi:hypothetical protein